MRERFYVGQPVSTPLGKGKVVGFEAFDADGYSLPIAAADPVDGGRVIVKLDDPSAWSPTPGAPDPYIFRRSVSAI